MQSFHARVLLAVVNNCKKQLTYTRLYFDVPKDCSMFASPAEISIRHTRLCEDGQRNPATGGRLQSSTSRTHVQPRKQCKAHNTETAFSKTVQFTEERMTQTRCLYTVKHTLCRSTTVPELSITALISQTRIRSFRFLECDVSCILHEFSRRICTHGSS